VSVIQPNVGRMADYFRKNPGAIQNPRVWMSSKQSADTSVNAFVAHGQLIRRTCIATFRCWGQGPRQDAGNLTGLSNNVNPGIGLVEKIYSYVQQKHSKSKVMATGIRHKRGAALSRVQFSSNHVFVTAC